MRERMVDVVVVGAGIAGAATTYALARRGVDVVALERFEIGHRNGSSHGASRIFRFSYPDPTYVRMAQRALEMWRALEEEVGEELVTTTGGLDMGRSLKDHAAALDACGAPYSILSGEELVERWPIMSVPPDTQALFQPDAGIVRAGRAWRAFVDGARTRGASVEEGTKVMGLRRDGDEVTIDTSAGQIRAKVAVVTAGPWAPSLLEPLGIDLAVRPSVETVAYFSLEDALAAPSLVDWGDPAVYSLASPDPLGLKVGLHHAGPEADPERVHEPAPLTIEKVSRWVAGRFPSASAEPLGAETCFYTNTADESFVMERQGSIVVGSPCSGHGFKFAPLTGARLAALALGERMG